MFSKIVVPLSDLPETQRALLAAIHLAQICNAEIATISILTDPPAYASFALIVDPSGPDAMMEARRRIHGELHEKASKLAQEQGVHAAGTILEGYAGDVIPRFLKEVNADLLVIGLHPRNYYLLRLWDSVHDPAQRAFCSVLSVH